MDLSTKKIYNVRYGNGHITKIEKDLVWVLFENMENEICFHLLSAFTGETPFLKTDDEELLSYIAYVIKNNTQLEMKEEAVFNLKQLGVKDECINNYKNNNTIYLITGKAFTPIDDKLYNAIKKYEKESKTIVYGVMEIPDNYGEKSYRLALLSIEEYPNVKSFIRKGKCCFVRSRIWNSKTEQPEYFGNISIHIANSGLWCMPLDCCHW